SFMDRANSMTRKMVKIDFSIQKMDRRFRNLDK
ncbi:MAG: hypothetical protein ACI8QH_001615, partial [Flammeovirgaceae bacterium]